MKDEFAKLLREGKIAEFKERCGDTFVYGRREGRVNRSVSHVATTTGRTEALSRSQAAKRAAELAKLQKQLQERLAKSRR